MNNTLGLIVTGGDNPRLKELTAKRSVSAIPYGGRYRTIDFVLSNMINSGINKVGLVTQYSFRSLMDHIGNGKEWDLDRRRGGLYFFAPYLSGPNSGWYKGSADGIYQNISFLKRSKEEFVLFATGNCIYKTKFDDMLKYHKKTGADITVCTRDMSDIPKEEHSNFGIVHTNEEGRIVEFYEKPLTPRSTIGSMGIYIIRRKLLIELIELSASQGYYDFVRDILIKKLDKLKVMAYSFDGYWRSMCSIPMLYKTNMDALKPEVRKELYMDNGKVYTKIKDEPPAKFNVEAETNNSIIADGCIIEGNVINSVIFRGVKIGKGAVVKNSIIMQNSIIENNVKLTNVILDKDVKISESKELVGEEEYPYIVGKGISI